MNQYWIWNTLGCSINKCKVQSQTIGTAHWYFVCNGQRHFSIALSLLNSKTNLIHILTLYLICGSFAEDRNSRTIWLGVPKYKFLLAIRLVAIGSEVVPEDEAPHVEVFYKYIRYITTYLLNMLFILFACIWRHTHFSLTVFFFITLLLVPISEKMDIDCEARDLADEGLYVGRKPLVMAKERCKMENRLIKEPDGQVWI